MYLQEIPKFLEIHHQRCGDQIPVCRDESVYEKVKDFQQEINTLKNIFTVYGDGEIQPFRPGGDGESEPRSFIRPHMVGLAHIIFTSAPRAIPGRHALPWKCDLGRQVLHRHVRVNETSQVISILPWAHVYGQNCDLHNYLYCGGGIALSNRWKNSCRMSRNPSPRRLTPFRESLPEFMT
jgi:long-chain acyl-CoA synthetase